MGKTRLLLLIVIYLFAATGVSGYKILYAEQFYRLYHRHFYQYPEDYLENIYYLEQALRADFANPLNALARIDDTVEWERYRNLFRMHVSLRLTELYIGLGSKYDRQNSYFFNYPWKRENIESLKVALESYKYARTYWTEALKWNQLIGNTWTPIEEIQYWEDESFRIKEKALDYGVILEKHIKNTESAMQEFIEMDESTY